MANQVAAGLALSIFGVGLSAFIGKPYESVALASVVPIRIPLLAEHPLLGPALFHQQALVYFSWVMLAAVAWFLYRTRPGLTLRAVGESPVSAHDIGHPVIRIRYMATLFGGAMAGIGGAFLSVFYTPMWVEGHDRRAAAGSPWPWWSSPPGGPCASWSAPTCSAGAMIAQMFVQGSGCQISIPAQFLSVHSLRWRPYWCWCSFPATSRPSG